MRSLLLAAVLGASSLGLLAQTSPPQPSQVVPPATPAAGSPAPPSTLGTPADGRIFRILDRITREVDSLVMFQGRIPEELTVGRNPSGALTLCVNCGTKAPENPSKSGVKAETAVGDKGVREGSGGDLLLLDLKGMYDLRLEYGTFVYSNDDGFDADDRVYEAYPTAGPDSGLARIGNLLLLSNRAKTPGCPFEVALRSWGTTYLAPIGDCERAPSKAADADAGPGGLRDLTRDHRLKADEWTSRHKVSFRYREGASEGPLTTALAVLAAGKEDFLALFDLRKLESPRSSYFWMTQRPHRTIRLDQNTVTVEGSGDGPEAYEPATFVEYPYLAVLGSYAKVRLTPSGGGPETVLTLGFCDECPQP